MNANGLYNGLEGYIVPGTNSGMGNGVANGVVNNEVNTKIGILDKYIDAAAAYSLRRLSVNYNGPTIRVRRSSDNTEQDIGFNSNGDLDEGSLSSFVGVGNGFVSVWYDQSRNGRNILQVTQSRQPRIVSAGVIDKRNNKPIVFFDGTDNLYTSADITHTSYSVFSAVYFRSAATTANSVGTLYRSEGTSNILTFGGNVTASFTNERIVLYNAESGVKGFAYTDADIAIGAYIYSIDYTYLNSLSIYQNRNNLSLVNIPFDTSFYPKSFRVLGGGTTATDGAFSGEVFEFILYTKNQTNNIVGIQSNINSYYKIY